MSNYDFWVCDFSLILVDISSSHIKKNIEKKQDINQYIYRIYPRLMQIVRGKSNKERQVDAVIQRQANNEQVSDRPCLAV